MKSCIIGACDLLSWNDIKAWVLSLKEVNYAGDVVLLVYRAPQDLITNAVEQGVIVVTPETDEFGQPINHTAFGLPTQSHKLRYLHAWQFLNESKDDYDMVMMSDTRDVYFQHSPETFWNTLSPYSNIVMLPSEGVLFKDEPWNAQAVRSLFGPAVISRMNDLVTINSGTFFGWKQAMMRAFLNVYYLCKNANITGADQPTLAVLASLHPESFVILHHDAWWACQCGTTLDITKPKLQRLLQEPAPRIQPDHIVVNSRGTPYVCVHQYDRVSQLAEYIQKKYTQKYIKERYK